VATDRAHETTNARARDRLTALVGRLSDADLARPVGHGWTVATALLHLAFWDLRAAALVDRYRSAGVSPSPVDVDVVNDTVLALAPALAPRAVARLAVDAAAACDQRIAALPDPLLDAILAAGSPFSLARHVHREEHVEEIERALR
jgi:hypothetical protein